MCPACEQNCAWAIFWANEYADQNFGAWDTYGDWLALMLPESKH